MCYITNFFPYNPVKMNIQYQLMQSKNEYLVLYILNADIMLIVA